MNKANNPFDNRVKVPKKRHQEIHAKLESGATQEEVASEYGLSRGRVAQIDKKVKKDHAHIVEAQEKLKVKARIKNERAIDPVIPARHTRSDGKEYTTPASPNNEPDPFDKWFKEHVVNDDLFNELANDTRQYDLIIADPPYGITDNVWDKQTKFDLLNYTRRWFNVVFEHKTSSISSFESMVPYDRSGLF